MSVLVNFGGMGLSGRCASRQVCVGGGLCENRSREGNASDQKPYDDGGSETVNQRRNAVGKERDGARVFRVVRIGMDQLMRLRKNMKHSQQKNQRHKKHRTDALSRPGMAVDRWEEQVHSETGTLYQSRQAPQKTGTGAGMPLRSENRVCRF